MKFKITQSTGKRETGAGYPAFALEVCIRFAEGLKDLGGSRSAVKKSILAKHFGLSESTPSFFQKIGAAKTFGIIDGWGSYLLTDFGKRYFYPSSDSEKKEALLSFIAKPPPFSMLLKRFDGEKLPSLQILGNILHQESSVPDSWKDRLASLFVKSAEFAGIIDTNGFLRHDAAVHTISSETPESGSVEDAGSINTQPHPEAQDTPQGVIRHPRRPEPAAPGNTAWIFPYRGSFIRLETPEKMPSELWEKLNAYVQILKPFDSNKDS